MQLNEVSRRSFLETSLLGSAGVGLALAATERVGAAQSSIIPLQLDPGEKLKVGIIGCGNHSRSHIGTINRNEQIEITAMCDLLPDMLEEKKRLVARGNPRLYTDYEEMVKQEDLHSVTLTLPIPVHKPAAIAALEAGKHVLCEKPMAMNVTDCKAMIAAADRARKVLQISVESCHSPINKEIAKQVHGGAIGNVLYAWLHNFRHDWRKINPDTEKDARINWRMHLESNGGSIYELIHATHRFCWYINSEPVEIAAMGGYHNSKLEKRTSFDHSGVLVRFANGVLLTYGASTYLPPNANLGPNALLGDNGTLIAGRQPKIYRGSYLNSYRHFLTPSTPDPTAEIVELSVPQESRGNSDLEYAHLYDAVQGKKPAFPSGRDHLPALTIARGSIIATLEKRVINVSEVD